MSIELRSYARNPDNLPVEEVLTKGDFLELKTLNLAEWSGHVHELLLDSEVLGVLIYIPGIVVQDIIIP